MAKIVVHPWPEPGHQNPMLNLARRLAARGHEPVFLSPERASDAITRAGFAVRDPARELELGQDGADPMAYALALRRHARRFCEFVLALNPGVALVDPLYWRENLRLAQLGVLCVHACTSLPDDYDPRVPPWDSTYVPNLGALSSLRCRLEWARVDSVRWLRDVCGLPMSTHALDLREVPHRLSDARWPSEWCVGRAFHKPSVGLPELVLCPQAFEYAFKRQRPLRTYVDGCIDHLRDERDDVSSLLDASKPLVIVSLGSQAARYKRAREVYAAVAGVASRMPHVQFAVASGGVDISSLRFGGNVLVRPWLPQLTLLGSARVLVTHGGLGAVKEALYFGVPLCVVPFGFDQPSVAARVEHHGVGRRLRANRLDVHGLSVALAELIDAPHIATRARLMAQQFRADEQRASAVDAVEQLCRASKRTGAPHAAAPSSLPIMWQWRKA